MTRETKIGLLVGLAFIIVIGILLSDQLMRATEPPPAPRSDAADNVRKGAATPASGQSAMAPVTPPRDVAPGGPVPTREEVAPPAPPVTVVEIRPGNGAPVNPPLYGSGAGGAGPVANNGTSGGNAGGPVVLRGGNSAGSGGPVVVNGGTSGNGGARSIAEEAAARGEPLVGTDGRPLRASETLRNNTGNPGGSGVADNGGRGTTTGGATATTNNGMRQYKVEPGDNLSRIAARFYGSGTKAHQALIIKANPSLQANPDKVVIGQTYNIPPAGGTGAAAPGFAGAGTAPVPPAGGAGGAGGAVAGGPSPRTPAEVVYTVKEGDSLWRIAKEQCGDAGAVAAIKELNRDVLGGKETVTVNMKLKLPTSPRPVASIR